MWGFIIDLEIIYDCARIVPDPKTGRVRIVKSAQLKGYRISEKLMLALSNIIFQYTRKLLLKEVLCE